MLDDQVAIRLEIFSHFRNTFIVYALSVNSLIKENRIQ